MNTALTTQTIGRKKLVLIIGLFIVPLIIATLWYLWLPLDYKPSATTNHGQLIQPPYPIKDFTQASISATSFTPKALQHTWTLVYLLDRNCDEACSKVLYNARQVRTALGKDTERVKRVTVLSTQALASTDKRMWDGHPDMTLLIADAKGLDGQIKVFTAKRYPQDSLYLIDPLGNLMMQFDPQLEPKWLLQDLQKLLRLSHVG